MTSEVEQRPTLTTAGNCRHRCQWVKGDGYPFLVPIALFTFLSRRVLAREMKGPSFRMLRPCLLRDAKRAMGTKIGYSRMWTTCEAVQKKNKPELALFL